MADEKFTPAEGDTYKATVPLLFRPRLRSADAAERKAAIVGPRATFTREEYPGTDATLATLVEGGFVTVTRAAKPAKAEKKDG